MQVLYVCTANICRSVSAQLLLGEALADAPELADIEVRSAGTAAVPGSPGCPVAPALAGHAHEHQAQPLTVELIRSADLILPAAREHRAVVIEAVPAARSRTFTIRQAGRIADWMVDTGMVAAAPLPDDPAARWTWLVSEMDAARGFAGGVSEHGRHPDDVPDPHVLGMELHPLAHEEIQASTDALARVLREVAAPR